MVNGSRSNLPTGRPRVDWNHELKQHDRWLRTVVYARVGELHAVDDVMQEVALAAVRQSAPLEDPAKVAPWLYRLAIRQSLLYRRRCGRRRKLLDRYVDRLPDRVRETDAREPLQWLMADERQQQVRQALAELPRRDREILLLKYAERWSYHQIAAHLQISHSAVEARLHRARSRLRSQLAATDAVEVH